MASGGEGGCSATVRSRTGRRGALETFVGTYDKRLVPIRIGVGISGEPIVEENFRVYGIAADGAFAARTRRTQHEC